MLNIFLLSFNFYASKFFNNKFKKRINIPVSKHDILALSWNLTGFSFVKYDFLIHSYLGR